MLDSLHLSAERSIRAGFKLGSTGPHNSRTMMLDEIGRCLDVMAPEAGRSDYRAAIVDRNILGKNTESSRKECFRRLRELYGLDAGLPLFYIFRWLDATDILARPLLAMLVSSARDPLLCATMPVIMGANEGDILGAAHFDHALEQAFPGRMKPNIRAATARHIASTWQQSGHLNGRNVKTRVRVEPPPAAFVMALLLGALQGVHGAALFTTRWCQILDLNAMQAQALATQAHREGLIDLRVMGTVVEITFPRFADILDKGDLHESL